LPISQEVDRNEKNKKSLKVENDEHAHDKGLLTHEAILNMASRSGVKPKERLRELIAGLTRWQTF
jgi:hypothetical protein